MECSLCELITGERFSFTKDGLVLYLIDHPHANFDCDNIFTVSGILKLQLWQFVDQNDRPGFAYQREGKYEVIKHPPPT